MTRIKLHRVKGTDKVRFDKSEFEKQMDYGLKKTAGKGTALFKRSKAGWRHRVNIEVTPVKRDGGEIYVDFGVLRSSAGNDIYSAVSHGTAKHALKARGRRRKGHKKGALKPKLWRREHWRPGTRPGSIDSRRGRSWGKWVRMSQVKGQSIRAREFDETIAKLLAEQHFEFMQLQMAAFSYKAWR